MPFPAKKIKVSRLLGLFLNMTKPVRIFEGSTRSTKTYMILMGLLFLGSKDRLVIRIFRAVAADCRSTVAQDLLDIVEMYFPGIGTWYESKKLFVIHQTGTKIYFAGCDNEKRLHGYKQDIAYFNEIMEVNYLSYNQVSYRTRLFIIMDFNPSVTLHWVFQTIMKQDPDKYDYCHSTYKDNAFLTANQIANIESKEPTPENIKAGTADYWEWQVYGLGQRCKAPGAIYSNWELVDYFPERSACSDWLYGMDFGFSVDPTTLMNIALSQNELYVREMLYQKELSILRNPKKPTVDCIQNFLEYYNISKSDMIVCDKSRPEHISDLCNLGYNAVPSLGARIEDGIEKVKNFHIKVLRSSQHTAMEFENYRRKEKQKSKKMVIEPIDDFNHCLDPVRYGVEYIHINKNRNPLSQIDFTQFFVNRSMNRKRVLTA